MKFTSYSYRVIESTQIYTLYVEYMYYVRGINKIIYHARFMFLVFLHAVRFSV